MGMVAPSAHHSGRTKSATRPRHVNTIQKIFRSSPKSTTCTLPKPPFKSSSDRAWPAERPLSEQATSHSTETTCCYTCTVLSYFVAGDEFSCLKRLS